MNARHELIRAYRRNYNRPMGRLFDAAGCPTESHGEGSYVFDEQGVPYLDLCAGFGVFGLGYGNQAILRPLRAQLESLAWLPPGARHGAQEVLAQRLRRILPSGLNHVLMSGSGSEACEYALATLLFNSRGRTKIVAAQNSYHGKTLGALCLMGQPHLRSPFGPLGLRVEFVPYGDLDGMRNAVDSDTLAVFLEPVLGGGHLTVPPAGYLAGVAALCRRTGAFLVLDEVQTGFGRTGRMFAFEAAGVEPDILIASKTITGGCVPISLTVVHERVGRTLYAEDGLLAPSWQGSLIACAAASASIDYLLAHDIPHQVTEKGRYCADRLRGLVHRYPRLVLDAPGVGLMLGIRVRSLAVEHALWLQLLSRNVIGGLSTNTAARQPIFRVFPPLTISYEEINRGLDALDESLQTLERWPSVLLESANRAFALMHYLPMPLLRLGCRAFSMHLTSKAATRSAPEAPVSTPSR